ncbi:MAG TPA: outer membrane protein assembly factor BamD [Methylomirabilota bacterium]|jgi:outer membrane protein assembly factor BamD|nr:outer membrane protein assembly factor BamD [Methylomirabilota bacterium]
MARALLLSVLLLAAGCAWLKPQPTPILPPEELYQLGETELDKKRFAEAREQFRKVVERHPNSSYAPRARFLIGESYYREADFDKAAKEFEAFLAFYPRHQIADLVQFRFAMAYYDQIKPIEQEQAFSQKAMEQFKKLVKEYPESRYATDAIAKIEVCRGRLAQKEVWVAAYYMNQGNVGGARQRLEKVVKEYPRAPVIPEALSLLADVNFSEGRDKEAMDLLRQVANDYSYTEWGKRAAQRLRAQR